MTASRSLLAAVRGLTAFAGVLLAATMVSPESAVASAFVVAVLALVVVAVVRSASPGLGGAPAVVRSRAALERRIPVAAQSDPDARGHARPRAPGALLPAV